MTAAWYCPRCGNLCVMRNGAWHCTHCPARADESQPVNLFPSEVTHEVCGAQE